MKIKKLNGNFSVLKLETEYLPKDCEFYFSAKTDDEFSLVLPTDRAPEKFSERSDGWKAFKILCTLDFSLVGILNDLTGALAENKIPVFAVSTFNTDYLFVKTEFFSRAENAFKSKGYEIV